MSSVIIRQLLEQAIPSLPTAWENDEFVPQDGVAYQQINILWAKPENPSYKGFHRERGYMQITLQYPSGVGSGDANTQAELIRSRFPLGKSFTSGQITVTVSGTPAISPGRNDGDRWAVPVKIPFFANVFE